MECQQRCIAQRKVHDRRFAEIPSRTHREYGLITRDRRNVAILKVNSAMLQPVLHYELEQVSKIEILRKLKKGIGGKTIRDVRFRVG